VASMEVTSLGNVPEGMVVRANPERRYADFAHVGPLEKLRDTYNTIYQTWLPQSGYQVDGNFDMEAYTDEFKDFSPDSVFYIYVPIR
jgi:AraC family transcriptional regulator